MVSSYAMASPAATLLALAHILMPSAANNANNQRHTQLHARQEFPGTTEGCFSSPGGGMENTGSYYVQSSLHCGNTCLAMGKAVMALHLTDCYCGNLLPATSSELPVSACNKPCDGWNADSCGGEGAYTVWLTGIDAGSVGRVGSSDPGSTSSPPSSSPASSSPPSSSPSSRSSTTPRKTPHTSNPQPTPVAHHHVHKAGGNSHSNSQVKSTVRTTQKTVVTKTYTGPSQSADSQNESESSSSPNGSVIGIAVGVIGGVLAFAGLVAIVLFYLRRRRRMKNAEKGHRRADSLNAFVASGARTPGSSATSSFGPLAGKVPPLNVEDTRLDPRIMQETRRISGASFLADNEDYSRRILKVTNPDRG